MSDTTVSVEQDLAALQADAELSAMFIAEALDHLSTIEGLILQLEATPGDTRLLNDAFRPFHTVKGNAGAVGAMTLQELAHKTENLLDLCRSEKRAFGPAEADAVLKSVDLLTGLINDLQDRLNGQPGRHLEGERQVLMRVLVDLVAAPAADAPAAAPAASVEPPAAAAAPADVLDADALFPLDDIVTPPAEAASSASAVPKPIPAAAAAPTLAPAPAAAPKPGAPAVRAEELASVKVETRKLDNLVDMVGELVIVQSIIRESPSVVSLADERLTRTLAQLSRITSDLQRNAMSMRMMPIRQTFQKMARLVRDLSKKSGKPVELVLSGEDTELDRKVVEDINDPLMHMIRNSVDHGIEPPEKRVAAGKRPEGRMSLSAFHQGGNIVISIIDDGAGLNTDRILNKAIERGLVRPGEQLSPSDIHQLIFKPGFSTAEVVTELSGRGVGMDVVRRNIDALRGRIEIQSEMGKGTNFSIKLPLTLAILDGLTVRVGAERFVVPIFAVRESLRLTPEQIHSVRDQACLVKVRGSLIRLLNVGDCFGMRTTTTDLCQATIVVIEEAGEPLGLVVDELLGRQEVVIKSLGEAFRAVPGVAGSAILGDGRVGLILDAQGLFEGSRRVSAQAAA